MFIFKNSLAQGIPTRGSAGGWAN